MMSRILLALALVSIFSACSHRLYRHRTINVLARQSKVQKAETGFGMIGQKNQPTIEIPSITPMDESASFAFLQHVPDSVNMNAVLALKLAYSWTSALNKSNFRITTPVTKKLFKPVYKKLARKKILFKPEAHKGDNGDLILGLIVLLILAVLFVLLLNALFFHLSMAELWGKIANALLFSAILVLVILLMGTCN